MAIWQEDCRKIYGWQNSCICCVSKKYAYGITCKDLPFGVVPADRKINFVNELVTLYPICQNEAHTILDDDRDLLV